jgi:hypothetical protein
MDWRPNAKIQGYLNMGGVGQADMLSNNFSLRNVKHLDSFGIKDRLKIREVIEHQVDRSQFRVQSRSNSELNSKSFTRRSLSFKQSIPIVNKPKNTNQSFITSVVK